MPYDASIDLVARHLADAFGPETRRRVATVLVLTVNGGAGDAYAHLCVDKLPRDRLMPWLSAHFPTFTAKRPMTTPLGLLMDLLEHRTGNATVDRVLEACDKACRTGDGSISRWLE
jgi:hypothetical protein